MRFDPQRKSQQQANRAAYDEAEADHRAYLERIQNAPVKPGRILGVDLERASLLHLLLLIPAAWMHRLMCWLPLGLRRFLLSFFGVSALVSPLFMWMAATKWLLVLLLGYALVSIAICWLVVMFSPEDQL